MVVLETARLRITPADEAGLALLISKYETSDPELSGAYREMRENCLARPDLFLWHTAWEMRLKDGGAAVGDVGFKGLADGVAEIGYGVLPEHAGNGYATEATRALCAWAFENGASIIEAETAPGNDASRRVLQKCGFVPTGVAGKEGPRYRLDISDEKKKDGRA